MFFKSKNQKKYLALLLFFIFSSAANLYGQVSVYTFSEAVSTYTPLSGGTTAYAGSWDNHTAGAAAQVTIPFSFNYDGVSYTQCYVSPNGFITFGTVQPGATNYTPISDNTNYNSATTGGVVSALGVNLKSGSATSSIKYGLVGSSPNRTFVIEWIDAQRVAGLGNFNFQIRLSETTSAISFSYGVCQPQGTTDVLVQVGLRGPNSTYLSGNTINRLQGSALPWFGSTFSGPANNSTIKTSIDAYPNSGLLYTYTPALPCAMPTASPTNLILGATSITDVAVTGNSFTAASPAPSKYLILRSTSNTAPTSSTIVNRTFYQPSTTIGAYFVVNNTSSLTFNQTTLSPDTTYYYWIIPYNDACQGGPFYKLTSILTASVTTCSRSTTTFVPTVIGGNSFTATWTTTVGATNYFIDVSTNSTFTALVPGYSNLSVGNVTSLNITGLSPATTYYFRVRAQGIGCLVNSNVNAATTTCGSYSIPYYENFDALATGVIPACGARTDVNADAIQWQTQPFNFSSASRSMQIDKNATTAMNDWFFLPALNLTAGLSYRLFFRYNTGSGGSTSENLKVYYGAAQNVAGMANSLVTMTGINNSAFLSKTVDFTPASSGSFYIGFQGSSAANQTYMVIDDISVTLTPACSEPSNGLINNITSTTATLSWTASSPAPTLGYQYYVSQSNVAPNAATVPTGSVSAGVTIASLTSLLPNTYYYVWVRGNCTAADKSAWVAAESFNTECAAPAIATTVPVTRCGYGNATISATPNTTATLYWYDAATGGNLLGTGNNYTTPAMAASTTYYVEAKASGALAKVGPSTPALQGGTLGVQNFQDYFTFTVTTATTLQSIDIYPMVSGQTGRIIIRNTANIALALIPYTTTVSGGATAQQLAVNYALTPGFYNLYFETLPASGLRMNTTNAVYPYSSSVAIITGNGTDFASNLGVYNWKFTTECISPRVPVAVTVSAPPALSLSASTTTICEGLPSALITVNGYAAYDTLSWSPNTGISGSFAAGFTFNPTATTTYYLNASQSGGSLCGNRVALTVTVLPAPGAISVLPINPNICINSVQPLTGSMSLATPTLVYAEDFNAATNNWVVQNTSFGGDTSASQWKLRPNNYSYISQYWNVNFVSNDASQFYLANADSQTGAPAPVGTVTRTTLTSPSISLAGYTTATLNFWQYIRFTDSDSFLVQVSTTNGASWNTVKSYNTIQGTALSFANANIDLGPYVGFPNVKIRFNFTSYWAYGWAIDNVSITGTLAASVTWSPITNLYNDINATSPYVANTPVSVIYAKPPSTTTYTATLTALNGCMTTTTSVVTVTPLSVGGTVSSSQYVCSGTAPSNLTLSGHLGNVVRWEYADDAAFTVNLTPIVNTTTTLTAPEMGTFLAARYFRAVVRNGNCNEANSSGVFIDVPTTTWNGSVWSSGTPNSGLKAIFEGNYTSAGDLSACSVLVNSGNVVFNPNHSLIVTNEVVVSGGSLVFENNSSLVQLNETVNSGNITYRRNTMPVKKFDYTYWSTPVSPQKLVDLSPDTPSDKYYKYDQITDWWMWVSSLSLMDVGRGYIIRAPYFYDPVTPAVYNATFYGTPNNGTINFPIVVNLGVYNLIGNPYPSALNINKFLSEPSNVSKVDATVYLWTHNTPISNLGQYTSNDYAAYNYLGGTGTTSAPNAGINSSVPTGKIASGQAFFIKGLSNGDVTFNNTMRLPGNNNQFFRMDNPPADDGIERHRFWLDVVSNQGVYKQTLVGYAQYATNAIDRGFDGDFMDVGNGVAIYTLCSGSKLSIQGRQLPFAITDEVPLGFKGNVSGDYHISLHEFDGLFLNQNIFIKDTFLNVIHNLKQGDYVFHSEPGIFDNRFVIVYTDTTLGNHTSIYDDAVVLYKPNDKLIINSGNKIMKEVKVFDVRGRLLQEKTAVNASETSLDLGTTNQVFLIEITTDDLKVIKKKYVN